MTVHHNNQKKDLIPPASELLAAIQETVTPTPGLFSEALLHEVRNPLTNINMAVEILKRLTTDNDHKVYLAVIMRASLKINGLIDELVRHQYRDHSPSNRKYSLHRLLDEVLLLAKDRLLMKNIIVSRINSTQDYFKKIDRGGMKIALTNILINAIDAMDTNGELKLVTRFNDDGGTIEIEDNGCGIPASQLNQIFLPYFTSKKDGLGIGLAATLDIFKFNNVTVNVESKEGLGTKFILFFEASEAPRSEPEKTPHYPPGSR